MEVYDALGGPAEGRSALPRDMGFIELVLERRIGFCQEERGGKGHFRWRVLPEQRHGGLT